MWPEQCNRRIWRYDRHGVADPTEVVRTSLQSAVSLACLILVTEATINEKVEEVTWEDLGIKVGK